MQRMGSLAAAVAYVGAEVAALLALLALGPRAGTGPSGHPMIGWAMHAPTDVLVAAAARGLGVALTSWLLAATLLSGARRIVPGWRRRHALDFATPAIVRRLLDRTLVVGLGASIVLGSARPAGATGRNDRPVVRAPAATTPAPRRAIASPTQPSAPPSGSSAAPPLVIVAAGDNLWVIARRAVGSDRASAIAPYWRRVIDANVGSLRSHDPDLIYPGERITLPPTG